MAELSQTKSSSDCIFGSVSSIPNRSPVIEKTDGSPLNPSCPKCHDTKVWRAVAMILQLPKKSAKIWGTYELRGYRSSYVYQRKRIANKLQNPRINQITFHTLHHWKATMEYHKTKDILYVMRLLGHKNIKNTLIYTQLVTFQNDDYICKAAANIKEAAELIEAGFEYVCEISTVKLFRKRK